MTQPGRTWISVHETCYPSPFKSLPWTKLCLTGRWISSQTCESSSQLPLFNHPFPHLSPCMWDITLAATNIIPFHKNHGSYRWFWGDIEDRSHFIPLPRQLKTPIFRLTISQVFTRNCWANCSVISALLTNAGALPIWQIYFTLEHGHTLAHESLNTLHDGTPPYFSRGRATETTFVRKDT